jgi:hypothetical protein
MNPRRVASAQRSAPKLRAAAAVAGAVAGRARDRRRRDLIFIICCNLINALFSWFSMIFTAGVALNVVNEWKMDSTASWTG